MRVTTTKERRARLAVRHRLAASARVDDDLVAIVRAVVVLHATDPAVPRFPTPLTRELAA